MSQDGVPLCLDIIGTLTPANIRHERFISAFKESPPLLGWLIRRWRENKRAASRRPAYLLSD